MKSFGVMASAKQVTVALGILSAVMLGGCQQLGSYSNTRSLAAAPTTLSGSHIFVYSFVDLRRDMIGRKLVSEIDQRLLTGFSAASIQTKLAMPTFGSREALASDSIKAAKVDIIGELNEHVSIDAVLAAHAGDEKAFGSSHRLLIVPIKATQFGTTDGITRVGMEGGAYTLRWSLIDVATHKLVWSSDFYENNSGHKNDRYQERAQNWVDGAIAEMRRSHLLPAAVK